MPAAREQGMPKMKPLEDVDRPLPIEEGNQIGGS